MEHTFETLVSQIGQSAFNTVAHNPIKGAERQNTVINFINAKAEHYAEVLNMDKLEILKAWEAIRGSTIAVNFYQEYMLPTLHGAYLFKTVDEFNTAFPSHKSKCPQCKGTSTDYYRCNSGLVFRGATCKWEANPMINTNADDYIRILIMEKFNDFPTPQLILKPVELCEPEGDKVQERVIKKLV